MGQAGDGATAVELAEQLRPDLVILDVKMPVLDGIAAAEQIAAQRIAPVVILTAFSQRDLVERARDAGAMAYLVKPFTKAHLVPAIEMAVSRFAELAHARGRGGRPDRAAGDPQGRRAGQGRAQEQLEPLRAGGVPLDPEDRDGPAPLDAPGRRRRGRARPGHRRAPDPRAGRSRVSRPGHDRVSARLHLRRIDGVAQSAGLAPTRLPGSIPPGAAGGGPLDVSNQRS